MSDTMPEVDYDQLNAAEESFENVNNALRRGVRAGVIDEQLLEELKHGQRYLKKAVPNEYEQG